MNFEYTEKAKALIVKLINQTRGEGGGVPKVIIIKAF